MKTFKFLFLLALLPFFMGCEDDDPVVEGPNIVEVASSDARFSTLVSALEKANLTNTLESSLFTVFAPTNEAFDQLFTDLGVDGLEDLSVQTLEPILLYHVINARIRSTQLSEGYATTLSIGPESTFLSLQVSFTPVPSLNGDVPISDFDIEASNGFIHAIDEVLLPPSVVDLALNNDNFSMLVQALTRSDLSTDFVSILNGDGPFTVFAPTNDAFAELLADNPNWATLDDIDAATLEAVLSYHVLENVNLSGPRIANNAQITTLEGSPLSTNVSENAISLIDGQGGISNVVLPDVQGANGVVHAIDRVLIP